MDFFVWNEWNEATGSLCVDCNATASHGSFLKQIAGKIICFYL